MSDDPKKRGVSDAERAPFEADKPAAKPLGRTLKVRKIGNSLGVVLPKDVLAKLGAGEGDELSVSDAPEGVTLKHEDSAFQEQIEAARRAMKRYHNALRELAN